MLSKFSKSNKKGKENVAGDKENGRPRDADKEDNINLPADSAKSYSVPKK